MRLPSDIDRLSEKLQTNHRELSDMIDAMVRGLQKSLGVSAEELGLRAYGSHEIEEADAPRGEGVDQS
jgi:nucleoid DNA-binding protein